MEKNEKELWSGQLVEEKTERWINNICHEERDASQATRVTKAQKTITKGYDLAPIGSLAIHTDAFCFFTTLALPRGAESLATS